MHLLDNNVDRFIKDRILICILLCANMDKKPRSYQFAIHLLSNHASFSVSQKAKRKVPRTNATATMSENLGGLTLHTLSPPATDAIEIV